MNSAQIPFQKVSVLDPSDYRRVLIDLLRGELEFHDQHSGYASHNFHSFPAKFPPQLPRLFIDGLTMPGDLVLDPMAGSGTTLLESVLAGRRALGFDIDPLAIRISRVKSQILDSNQIRTLAADICTQARARVRTSSEALLTNASLCWDEETRTFINYWFLPETQTELLALLEQIKKISQNETRHFFELAFSAIIITKSSSVSLALDLAHTRPHRAKLVYSRNGEIVEGGQYHSLPEEKRRYLTKILRSPIDEFEKRVQNNLKGVRQFTNDLLPAQALFGNAQTLPLCNDSVDLVVTSPPYASNAIDYMRAHKFSLVWFGYPIKALGEKRHEYIGGEGTHQFNFFELPSETEYRVAEIENLDASKGRVLRRYYTEMTQTIREMYRVIKPGKAVIVVVGSSILRGKDTYTHFCLAEIGRSIGFEVPVMGVRSLDRDRRMLPAGGKINRQSQIQQRMHEEYVIGFLKPHIVSVTAEPTPSRLASLALGTGDLDCVYHFALPELLASAKEYSPDDAYESLQMMVDGKRLRDISDLPFDLAI